MKKGSLHGAGQVGRVQINTQGWVKFFKPIKIAQ